MLRLEPRGIFPMVARCLSYITEFKAAGMAGVHPRLHPNKVSIDDMYPETTAKFHPVKRLRGVVNFTLAHDDKLLRAFIHAKYPLHVSEAIIPVERHRFFLNENEHTEGLVFSTM